MISRSTRFITLFLLGLMTRTIGLSQLRFCKSCADYPSTLLDTATFLGSTFIQFLESPMWDETLYNVFIEMTTNGYLHVTAWGS